MKVTVQNGAKHGLTRADVESINSLLPSSWSKLIKQIALYQGVTGEIQVNYYPQKGLIGLYWPRPAEMKSKEDGLRELLIGISVVAAVGQLPPKLSKSTRPFHQDAIEDLLKRCMSKLSN
ncbi:MAG: hypothetical protein IPJ18_23010 [Betaproteobacteria bacterium]|nr:hypothetical protein [Betaproteobacteria bacterium]